MTNLNYKIVLANGKVEAFEKLELAIVFAKKQHLSYIDVCERSTGDVVDFIKVRLPKKELVHA